MATTKGDSPRPAVALTRRDFIKAGAAVGLASTAGGILEACSSTVRKAASVAPAGRDLGAVEHVVILVQENRSFDHYFGSYPAVNGFDRHPSGSPGVFAQDWPGAPADAGGKLLPFHLDTASGDAECIHDLSHAWNAQHMCWDHGANDAFVRTHTSPQFEGPEFGTLTMGYYTRADLPYHYALADAFTICDAYHCSVLGPTHPNRLMLMSGTIDPAGEAGGPVVVTSAAASSIFSVDWKTMPEVLSAKGVSWKFYNPSGPSYLPSSPQSIIVSDNIMLYFRQFSDPSSQLYRNAFGYSFSDDFARDIKTGSLPAVSWVIPPLGYDEHPPAPPARGAWFIDQVLQPLIADEKTWSKTVVFITYDENDGFFDHVVPPTPPAGTPGEYLSVNPLPTEAFGIAGPIGLGFRVPMLVVSPFSRGGYVCSETYDHTSTLAFIAERFGVEVPNVSQWRRKTVGDLTAALPLLGRPATSAPSLPATSQDPPVVQKECQGPQLLELDVGTTPYPVPLSQTMPLQEEGHRLRA